MSSTKVRCRNPICKKDLVQLHHSGAVHFTYGVVKSFDPAGSCLWLECSCGSRRSFDLVLAVASAEVVAITG